MTLMFGKLPEIIWTNGRWEIDAKGTIWLSSDVVNRKQGFPPSIAQKRDELMKGMK